MAYDYYWPGYDFTLDLESLQALGVPKEIFYSKSSKWFFEYLPPFLSTQNWIFRLLANLSKSVKLIQFITGKHP